MAAPNQNRLVFITSGPWSNSAVRLLESLRAAECPIQIEAHDIRPRLLAGWRARLAALPRALARGGPSIFFRHGAFRDAVKGSPWMVRRIGQHIADAAANSAGGVVLIIGTLLPGFVLDCPYFLFTDMPVLGNRAFPDGERRVDFWRDCLPLERWNLSAAAGVFTMSRFARKVLCDDYGLPASKVHCVGAGCNSPVEPEVIDRDGNLDVLFVGLDWHRKGGPELLDAFRIVRSRMPSATLTIIGCSPQINEPGVRVVGRVRPDELSDYYRQAAVFAMPSRREPFGIVYLEAMSAGLPAIATDRAAAPEMVRDGVTGYCVPPGDTAMLADRLVELLGNPARRAEMGRRGRQLVQSEYTWPRTASRILQVMFPQ